MKHYICTGTCMGVSNEPGVCHTPNCPKDGMAMEECNCEDGKHFGRQEKKEDAPSEQAGNSPSSEDSEHKS